MEEFVNKLINVNEPKKVFILCAIFIFSDIITGYLKAWKFNKTNSSISRDGFIKKIGWVIALLLGFFVDVIADVNVFLIGSAVVCIVTEGISVYENLGELGIDLPFKEHFEKLNKNTNHKEKK